MNKREAAREAAHRAANVLETACGEGYRPGEQYLDLLDVEEEDWMPAQRRDVERMDAAFSEIIERLRRHA